MCKIYKWYHKQLQGKILNDKVPKNCKLYIIIPYTGKSAADKANGHGKEILADLMVSFLYFQTVFISIDWEKITNCTKFSKIYPFKNLLCLI